MKNNPKEHIEAKGFLNHNKYTDFVEDKYSDVSVAMLKNDFEMLKRTMRELIDNTYPYHSHKFTIPIKRIDENFKSGKNDLEYFKSVEYPEYYEFIVSQYYEIIKLEQKQVKTPKEQTNVAKIKDFFNQESRRLRRIIIKDLSLSNIIPKAETIKEQEVNSLLQ